MCAHLVARRGFQKWLSAAFEYVLEIRDELHAQRLGLEFGTTANQDQLELNYDISFPAVVCGSAHTTESLAYVIGVASRCPHTLAAPSHRSLTSSCHPPVILSRQKCQGFVLETLWSPSTATQQLHGGSTTS